MDIKKEYATDSAKEVAGVRHDLDDKGAFIVVARQGNTAYGKLMVSQYEKNARILKMKNDAAEAKGKEILLDVMARTILVGCGGLEIDGEEVPNTVEGRKSLLEIGDFRAVVQAYADDAEEYRIASAEEDAGNSQPA